MISKYSAVGGKKPRIIIVIGNKLGADAVLDVRLNEPRIIILKENERKLDDQSAAILKANEDLLVSSSSFGDHARAHHSLSALATVFRGSLW